jgi:hypothetical protein
VAIVLLHPHLYALSNVPFFEPQLFDASPQSDWTMESPFLIPINASAGFSPSLNNSRAITSVLGLTPEDTYDVAMFEIAANSPSLASEQVIIGLQALAPNCPSDAPLSSSAFYPSLALLGPSTDPSFATQLDESTLKTLPFSIPENYGAIIRAQPRVSMDQRSVYSAGPFNSYLLPYPVTPECIISEESFSNCANGTAAQNSVITYVKLTTPGKYYIVWWDPDHEVAASDITTAPSMEIPPIPPFLESVNNDGSSSTDGFEFSSRPGLPRQVTISFGVGEEPSEREQQLQMEVITGQKTPAFNPCTGAFIAPSVFVDGATMSPAIE